MYNPNKRIKFWIFIISLSDLVWSAVTYRWPKCGPGDPFFTTLLTSWRAIDSLRTVRSRYTPLDEAKARSSLASMTIPLSFALAIHPSAVISPHSFSALFQPVQQLSLMLHSLPRDASIFFSKTVDWLLGNWKSRLGFYKVIFVKERASWL